MGGKEPGCRKFIAILLPRRYRRRCMEETPLRSTRLLPRANGRMASLGYCQSDSYPTFHFSAPCLSRA